MILMKTSCKKFDRAFCIQTQLSAGMPEQGEPSWADLPLELLLSIIKELVGIGGADVSFIPNFRRACKAWNAACSQFQAALCCKKLPDLSRMCAAFPQVIALRIRVPECSAEDLRPLSSCTQLTSLLLSKAPMGVLENHPPTRADLHHLSNGLRNLLLFNVLPESSSFGKLRNVTELTYGLMSGHQDALSALIQEMPSLKVTSLQCLSIMLGLLIMLDNANGLAMDECTFSNLHCMQLLCCNSHSDFADNNQLCSVSLHMEKIGLGYSHLQAYSTGQFNSGTHSVVNKFFKITAS